MDRPKPRESNRIAQSHLSYRTRHRSRSHDSAHADDNLPDQNLPDHPLIPRGQATLIGDDASLHRMIDHVRAAGRCAYDTEFIGEMTYHPQLCLVQVATTTDIFLIDPLSDVALEPFWELLADPAIEKLVHAGEQDIEPVFRNIGRQAANVFDTQVAAGFCGMAYPVALSKLVLELLSIKLSKGHTFTDWQRRPLSPSQLRYAADDVRFLPAMAAQLKAQIDALNHTAWVAAECSARCAPDRYGFNSADDFYHLRGAGSLTVVQLAVLQTL
ncbi:MAG TPA: ribonuclease D, partial [Tepidisphaeraceae bacterium]|nr:ribonuclease D [Tepidisphaeraceae bacterium]